MAIVTKYGAGFKDPALINLPKPVFAQGRARSIITGTIAVSNTDSIASKHYLGKIPSHAVLNPRSTLICSAITGLTIYNVGLELNGNVVGAALLAAGLDLSTAGSKNPVAALVIATGIGRQLWQIAGAARDPGVEYDIVGSFGAAATAAGQVEAFIDYWMK